MRPSLFDVLRIAAIHLDVESRDRSSGSDKDTRNWRRGQLIGTDGPDPYTGGVLHFLLSLCMFLKIEIVTQVVFTKNYLYVASIPIIDCRLCEYDSQEDSRDINILQNLSKNSAILHLRTQFGFSTPQDRLHCSITVSEARCNSPSCHSRLGAFMARRGRGS